MSERLKNAYCMRIAGIISCQGATPEIRGHLVIE